MEQGLAILIIHMNCVGGRGGKFAESVFCTSISRHRIQAQLQQGWGL